MKIAVANCFKALMDAAERYESGRINNIGMARSLKDAISVLARILFEMVEK